MSAPSIDQMTHEQYTRHQHLTHLQRMLCTLVRDRPDSRQVLNLRQRILLLDPKAVIYETWGGPLPAGYQPKYDWYRHV